MSEIVMKIYDDAYESWRAWEEEQSPEVQDLPIWERAELYARDCAAGWLCTTLRHPAGSDAEEGRG